MKKLVLLLSVTFFSFQLFSQSLELVDFTVEKAGATYHGLKDKNGNTIVSPKFFGIEKIEDYYLGTTNSSMSYFDSKGKLLAQYDVIKPFKYGVAIINVFTDNGDIYAGLIDKKGKVILPPNKYNSINEFNEKKQASAFVEEKYGDREFIIDITGKVVN